MVGCSVRLLSKALYALNLPNKIKIVEENEIAVSNRKGVLAPIFLAIYLLIIPIVFGIYSIRLGQDINWDLQNYHLYNAYSFLNNRIHFDLAPAGLQTYFNPLIDTIYWHTIYALGPKATGFLIGFIQGISIAFIYLIASQMLGGGRRIYSIFIATTGVLSVGFLSEIGTTLHDSLVGLLILASLWLSILAIEGANEKRLNSLILISAAGFLAGLACGLKLVFCMYALAICLAMFLVPLPFLVRLKFGLIFGFFAFTGLAISGGFWLYKMWVEFGNPIFPQFNNIFQGELANFESARDIRFLPRNLYEKLIYPFIFTNDPLRVGELRYEQVSWIFGYVSFLALAVCGLLQALKVTGNIKLKPSAIFFIAYIFISYVVWLNLFGIYRYLIPIEVLLPLIIFLCIDYFLSPNIPRWTIVILLSFCTFANLRGVPDWWHSSWSNELYRVERSALKDEPKPAVIFLVGQPLGWLVPALDIDVPFIQLVPNIYVSPAYWSKAKKTLSQRSGRQYAVFESFSPQLVSQSNKALVNLGLVLDESSCSSLVGHLGTQKYIYRLCEVKEL